MRLRSASEASTCTEKETLGLIAAAQAAPLKLLARFETLYLTGWSPHESQQKPLKPGSAKSSLAAALGTDEQPLKG